MNSTNSITDRSVYFLYGAIRTKNTIQDVYGWLLLLHNIKDTDLDVYHCHLVQNKKKKRKENAKNVHNLDLLYLTRISRDIIMFF